MKIANSVANETGCGKTAKTIIIYLITFLLCRRSSRFSQEFNFSHISLTSKLAFTLATFQLLLGEKRVEFPAEEETDSSTPP